MLDLMGPMIFTKAGPAEESGFSALPAIIPAGTVIPVHSHADREVLVVIEGTLSVWLDGSWRTVGAGEIVDIPPHARHSLLNASEDEITMLLITTPTMKRFMEEISIPAADVVGPPGMERIDTLVARAQDYGYWLGTPEDQAALGTPYPVA